MSDKKPVKTIIHGYPEDMITIHDELICIKKEEKAHEIILTMTLKSLWLDKNKIHEGLIDG